MKKSKNLIIPIVIVIASVLAAILYSHFTGKSIFSINDNKGNMKVDSDKEVTIVDLNSKTRPYAVMINNLNEARLVQSGLSKSYLVYELLAEGGITRFLALFRDTEVEKIGSVRSARHYYLDYVLENDAIFVHWGWSPQAQTDIKKLKLQNIHGLTYEGTYFYRENPLGIAYEHTGFTNTELLDKARTDLKYPKDTDEGLLLDYSASSVDLTKYGEVNDANEVTLSYSNYIVDTYKYDEESKMYARFVGGNPHIDHNTEEQLMVKNIIVYSLDYISIAGDEKGRQDLNNIGTGNGYYITEGKVTPITWKKEKRDSKTIYKFENGKELIVNDGNTFIQILPNTGKVEIN